jgi:hypothetical protein
MSRRIRRRGSRVRRTFRDVILLVALCVVVWLAGHLALLAVVVALGAGGFELGRRVERRRGVRRPRVARISRAALAQAPADTRPLPVAPGAADQLAELEHVTGRPIEAVIESYRLIQSRYSGRRP